jgi:hypothetical protein
MVKRYGAASLLVFLCLILCASPLWAQWTKNGVLVCGADNSQYSQRIISDGAHGAIVVWMDYRGGMDSDIYGNKVEQDGHAEGWGLPICTLTGNQENPELIPDGTGGAIVVWREDRDNNGYYDIYAQRVDGDGILRWDADGLPVCTSIGNHDAPRIVPDGAGGAIIAWGDDHRGQWDIYAQRVTADGDTLWAANGVPVDTTLGDQYTPDMVSDGAGGAILVWRDTRSGDEDLYAQRIGGNGNLLWGTDAVPVCLASGSPWGIRLVAASDGGAIASWVENRTGMQDIYAQKIDQDGAPVWSTDGMAVCEDSWNRYSPDLADDGDGGAIVVWYDERSYYEVYAQRIASDGNLAWSECGVRVFSSGGDCAPRVVADGSGGAIVALDIYWDEESQSDIVAQRLDHGGNLLWGLKGASVCAAENTQYCPVLVSDGLGGAILAWEDYRVDNNYSDIYCQRISPSGLWGEPEPKIISCLDVPHDQGGWLRIRTRASALDAASETETPIFGYNVWRLIGGVGPFAASSGAATTTVDRSKLVALLSDPATANGVRVSGSQAIALGLPEGDWEAVAFWFATRDTIYSVAVPTKNDSTEAGTPWEDYIVTAHTTTAGIFVASEPTTGYSVDNLAPAVTTGFAGAETASPPGLELTWTPNSASDLWKYNVHRGNDELFMPDVTNLLGTTGGTALHDGTWVKAYQYFYKLVAVDPHGNMGPAALLRPEDVKVGTMLMSFAAALKQSAIEVSWKLSEADETVAFHVLRSAGGGEFAVLPSAGIAREALVFSIVDRSVEPGTTYRYRVAVVEGSSTRTLFETDAISTPAMPLTLNQNHPNPFNPSTTISYYLPAAGAVTLEVYDSAGRLVSRLVDGATQERGTHEVAWRGLDTAGRQASSGVYFYRLVSGKETISKKMVLLR